MESSESSVQHFKQSDTRSTTKTKTLSIFITMLKVVSTNQMHFEVHEQT